MQTQCFVSEPPCHTVCVSSFLLNMFLWTTQCLNGTAMYCSLHQLVICQADVLISFQVMWEAWE